MTNGGDHDSHDPSDDVSQGQPGEHDSAADHLWEPADPVGFAERDHPAEPTGFEDGQQLSEATPSEEYLLAEHGETDTGHISDPPNAAWGFESDHPAGASSVSVFDHVGTIDSAVHSLPTTEQIQAAAAEDYPAAWSAQPLELSAPVLDPVTSAELAPLEPSEDPALLAAELIGHDASTDEPPVDALDADVAAQLQHWRAR